MQDVGKIVQIRMNMTLIERIDNQQERLASLPQVNPAGKISRSDVIRYLLMSRLDELEEEQEREARRSARVVNG